MIEFGVEGVGIRVCCIGLGGTSFCHMIRVSIVATSKAAFGLADFSHVHMLNSWYNPPTLEWKSAMHQRIGVPEYTERANAWALIRDRLLFLLFAGNEFYCTNA